MSHEMSNHQLGVEVVCAYDLMPKDGQGTASAFVELHFDNQKSQTTTKEGDMNPVWDESFYFNISDPNHLPTLEAHVYNRKEPNSKSSLGKVCLLGTSFVPYSDGLVLQYYPLQRNGIFPRVKGELGLKVYHRLPNPNQEQQQEQHQRHEAPKVVPNYLGSEYMLKETSPNLGGGQIVRGRFVPGDRPVSTHDLVETMHYLFVRVVKALDLLSKDVTGSLDPYVEVKVGNCKGITKYFEKNQNPEWNEVFAFSKDNLHSSVLDVVVKDKGIVTEDDFVGIVKFYLHEVPTPDSPLAPEWYQIEEKDVKKGKLMVAVWYGTQADEAFLDAWHSDAHVRSKVYHSPRLWYLRVNVIEARHLVVSDQSRIPNAYAKVVMGNQCLKTKTVQSPMQSPIWNEELLLVAAEPFDNEYLIVAVEDCVDSDKEETLGRVSIAINSVERRADDNDDQTLSGQWFNLETSMSDSMEGEQQKKDNDKDKFSSRIHLRVCLDGRYHMLDDNDESSNYSSDLQPTANQLWKQIGVLELGVLNAKELMPMKTKDGKATIDAYCVAKYGHKWVRTRTITDNPSPKFNEQHTWEVYDPTTILTVGVYDNCQIGNSNGIEDGKIGKVRIRISALESGRVYTLSYPLLTVSPHGVKKMGELSLVIRFSCTSLVNLMFKYSQSQSQSQPLLPKVHLITEWTEMQRDTLLDHAVLMVTDRLGEAEPPLRKEVVQYILSDAYIHDWSLRRSKANFFRLIAAISGLLAVVKWFKEVSMWKTPITTALVHVLFVMLVCSPELILSTVFLYMFVIGMLNVRCRPRFPPYLDIRLSHADSAHPDELDEEFDTFPTSQPSDILRMRYDRLRSIAGRIQTVLGDVASQGERIQALLSWRDPRATTFFVTFCLVAAIVLYVTPFKVVVILAGFYFMRYPRFRSRLPSAPVNFFRRMPVRADYVL